MLLSTTFWHTTYNTSLTSEMVFNRILDTMCQIIVYLKFLLCDAFAMHVHTYIYKYMYVQYNGNEVCDAWFGGGKMTKMLSMRKRARERCEKEKLGVGRGLIGRHHNCPTGQQELSWPPNLFRYCIFQCRRKHCRLFPHESIIFNRLLWIVALFNQQIVRKLFHPIGSLEKLYSIFAHIKIAFYFIYNESYNWRFYKK